MDSISKSLLLFLIFKSCLLSFAQISTNEVKIVGAMESVMWKGELSGTINLDTIQNKSHLYGIGPVEFLAGELLILNGKSYVSKAISPTKMLVEESFEQKAPFFVSANVENWLEIILPPSIKTLIDLEQFLNELKKETDSPFVFKLEGAIDSAKIHIVNLPIGSTVRSPEEAHQGQINYPIHNENCTIIGFFSRKHQSIFTHHDTFMHLHLITNDLKKMGHLDELHIDVMKLYIAN